MSQHVDVPCATCGAEICLPANVEAQLRRTHQPFYCHLGHSNVFRGKTEEQKRIESLERTIDRGHDRLNDALAQREELIGVLKECPLCGYRSRKQVPRDSVAMGRGVERVHEDLREHLVAEHGARVDRVAGLLEERTG